MNILSNILALTLKKFVFALMKKMNFLIIHQSTSDVEYQFPFGWKELEGIAHRGDFDLTQHSKHSGKDLCRF